MIALISAPEVHAEAFVHTTTERLPRVSVHLVFASMLREALGIEAFWFGPVLRHVVREMRHHRRVRSCWHEMSLDLGVADRAARHDRYRRDDPEAFFHDQIEADESVEIGVAR